MTSNDHSLGQGSPAEKLSDASSVDSFENQDDSENPSTTVKAVIVPNIFKGSTDEKNDAKDEPNDPKQAQNYEESKQEHPTTRARNDLKGMSHNEYADWCNIIKLKMQPWHIIKEAGSNECDSWGEVSICANAFAGSNPEQRKPSIDGSNYLNQDSSLQHLSFENNRAKKHAINQTVSQNDKMEAKIMAPSLQ